MDPTRHYINLVEAAYRPAPMGRPVTESIETAASWLKRSGYQELGSGLNGSVFGREGDPFVLKVFSNNDLAYPDFVRHVLRNPSPHFPAFKGKLLQISSEYSAIRMERLDELPEETAKDLAAKMELYDLSVSNPEFVTRVGLEDRMAEVVAALKKQPGLFAAIEGIVRDLVLGKGYRLDCTEGNNLMRRGSTVVLIDPVYGVKELIFQQ